MFVPYDGQSKRFDVIVSAQRRYSAQKINREKRERAVKLKQRLDSAKLLYGSTPEGQSPYTPTESNPSPSTEDEDDSALSYSPAGSVTQENYASAPIDSTTTPVELVDADAELPQPSHEEALALTISSKLTSIASRDRVSGGLRIDPFQTYPIKWREYFPAVVDFCKEVVAPRPGYFRFLMGHDVLFEAIVTYILCVMPNKTSQTKLAMMYHYGCTLSKVGKLLSSETERASDAVILAIANLAVICAYCGDDRRFETHLKGIYRLIELRGGRQAVLEDENSWVETALTAVEALALVQSKKTIENVSHPSSGLLDIAPTPTLSPRLNSRAPIYPNHPFPPDLCIAISKMPEGFRELALTGSLSIQLMNRLSITRSQVVHLMATATNDERDRDWQSLLLSSTSIERMGWFAVLVYHLRSSTYISNGQELAKTILECARGGTKSQAEADWLLWGSCLLLSMPDPDRALTRERESVASMLLQNNEGLKYERLDNISKRFLWTEGLSSNLRMFLAHRIR